MHRGVVGTIGVIHKGTWEAGMGRSLRALELPGSVKFHDIEGSHPGWQRNEVVRAMQGSWLCFIDTDQTFQPDALIRLLAWRRPIVMALIAHRHSPFPICAFNGMRSLPYETLPDDGLVEVDAVGTGFTVIDRAVFNRMPNPWFEVGRINPERTGEDTWFSKKAREAGFTLAVDCGVRVGHDFKGTIWPIPGYGVKIVIPGQDPLELEIGVTQEQQQTQEVP